MVTQYNNSSCKYRLDKLDKVVYLLSGTPYDIHIDNGEAYINSITATPMSLQVYTVSLEENDEFDERYKFTHTVKFSVNGYADYKDFGGKYYVIVKSVDGVYWLVNPMFPCKVTSTYTLGANENHTDFTFATVSNHPVLKLNGFSGSTPYNCVGYQNCKFDKLRLNEKNYSSKGGNLVKYTNDGFKPVYFDKNSQTFTEEFDGTNVSHVIKFNIKFDGYKPSWQYNLLEFLDNKYSAIIETNCGKKILTGFHLGLQPSYTINSNNSTTPDNVEITLSDMYDSGDFIGIYDNIVLSGNSATSWVYTTEYDGWQCFSAGTAQYLLKKELDAFGNETGRWQCFTGYEEQFSRLNIVGTFSTVATFQNAECGNNGARPEKCSLRTNMSATISFDAPNQSKQYNVDCDDDWTLTSNKNFITVSPSSGEAASSYTVTVTNTKQPTASGDNAIITFSYCNKTKSIGVVVQKDNGCFNQTSYSINANGQYVTVPTNCCVSAVTETSGRITNIQITNSTITVYIPMNTATTARTFTFNVTFCDSTTGTFTVVQDKVYERWVKDEEVCNGTQKCDLEVKYTGVTASNINTRTDITRLTNCSASTDCQTTYTRWIDTQDTYCYNGYKFKVQKEQTTTDGVNWTDTGNKRLGEETQDSPDGCSGITYEYRWIITTDSTCVGTDSYYLYKQQRSVSGSNVWEDVIPTTKSFNGNGTQSPQLKQSGATECGYVPPVEPMYEWRLMNIATDWICDECDSLQHRWYTTSTYCNGNDLYEHQIKQYYSGGTWIDDYPEKSQDVIVEYDSVECDEYLSKPLTFVAQEDGIFKFSFSYWKNTGLTYSLDSGETWTSYERGSSGTPTIHSGETVMWKGAVSPATNTGIGNFISTGNFYAEGNAMSVLYGDDFVRQTSLEDKNTALYGLFKGCTGLTSAENMQLPATTLSSYCYGNMFSGCTSLENPPALPSTTLAHACYYMMFRDCYSLDNAPVLPATALTDYCYYGMFYNCDGLQSAPTLPATTLATSCYFNMFRGCAGLEEAPVLPATTLASSCYSGMFEYCINLQYTPALPATTLAPYCYQSMFRYITNGLKTVSILPATTLEQGCYQYMYQGSALLEAPILPATTLAKDCYKLMFSETYISLAPELPAATLVDGCYDRMFLACTRLGVITCLATDISASGCTTNWVNGVAASGTFTKASSMNDWTTDDNGIPSGWTVTNYNS